jgi:AAA domain
MTDDRSDEYREWLAEDGSDPLAQMFTGAWLDSQDFPPLEYVLPGIIPEGFGLLVAPPKAGKSWLVCGIGLGCASGGLALGRISVNKRAVLYLALEDGHRRLQFRSRRLMCGESLPAGIHFILKAKPTQVIPMIAEFLQRYGDEKPLIIVDTLGKARPPRPAGTDLYAWDYAIGTQFKDTIDTVPGAALLVVHHTRKTETSDFVDSVSGSHGIAGSADFILALSRKRQSDEALLSVTGRDVVEGEYALTTTDGHWLLDGEDLRASSVIATERRDTGALSDRTTDALRFVNGRPQTSAPDLADYLDISPDVAGKYLRRLEGGGRIKKLSRGLYTSLSEVSEVSEAEGIEEW